MRYGSRDSQPPTLLASGVVAGPERAPLVASTGLADASAAPGLGATRRAVTLSTVTPAADDYLPVAPGAVEHAVAVLDGCQLPATEGWTQPPPFAILSFVRCLSLRR